MKALQLRNRRSEPSTGDLIRLFQSETAELDADRPPIQAHLTILGLAALLVVAVLIGVFFKIDRVVTSVVGQVVTIEPTVVMQPLDASIIKSLSVREGDRVRAGQVLASLDPTFAAADTKTLQLQIAGLDAQIARDEAELTHKPLVMPVGGPAGAEVYQAQQRLLYEQQTASIAAQVRTYDQQIEQYKATVTRVTTDADRYADRQKLASQIQDISVKLEAMKFGSKLDLLKSTDQTVEMKRNMESARNSLAESQHQLQATVEAREGFVQQQNALISQDLVTAKEGRDAAAQQLDKAVRHQDLVRLVAPQDAIVLKMEKLSVGSVIQPSEPLIELASLHAPLEAEIYIQPSDVGFVRPGDKVTLKLDAFEFAEHGWAEGRLRWISQGTFSTPETGAGGAMSPVATSTAGQGGPPLTQSSSSSLDAPYYKARVIITKLLLKQVPKDTVLVPGMTLHADIHVGSRSLFWYLAGGMVRGTHEAMREP